MRPLYTETSYNPYLISLVKEMLSKSPKYRPTTFELLDKLKNQFNL